MMRGAVSSDEADALLAKDMLVVPVPWPDAAPDGDLQPRYARTATACASPARWPAKRHFMRLSGQRLHTSTVNAGSKPRFSSR